MVTGGGVVIGGGGLVMVVEVMLRKPVLPTVPLMNSD